MISAESQSRPTAFRFVNEVFVFFLCALCGVNRFHCSHCNCARSIYVPRTSCHHTLDLGPPPPPLKVPKGHMGNIQCIHMGGGLNVPGPHVTLWTWDPPPPPAHDTMVGPMRGWTSHRSCLSTASSLCCFYFSGEQRAFGVPILH